jgi:hypothetical protein
MAMYQNADTFMINYTGHGDPETGGWAVSLLEESHDAIMGTILMDDILDIITKSEFKGSMEICSDSPYSGKLCYAAKDYFNKNNLSNAGLKYKIMASTSIEKSL